MAILKASSLLSQTLRSRKQNSTSQKRARSAAEERKRLAKQSPKTNWIMKWLW
jgi:hypothetical protein